MKAIVCFDCAQRLSASVTARKLTPARCDCCDALVVQGEMCEIETATFPPALPSDDETTTE